LRKVADMNRGSQTPTRATGRVAINGYTLRAMRILAGLTTTNFLQQVVTDTVNLDRTLLNRIENGHVATVRADVFNRFVAVLGLEDRKALMANPHGNAGQVAA